MPCKRTAEEKAPDTPEAKAARGALAATQGAPSPAAVRGKGGEVAFPFPAAHEPCGRTVYELQRSVRGDLRRALASAPSGIRANDVPVHEHPALAIKVGLAPGGGLSCFKAPWSADSCKNAILTTGWYEAGGDTCWADAVARGPRLQKLVGDEATWGEVEKLAEQHFSHDVVMVDADALAATQGDDALPRVVFPAPIAVWIEDR